MSETVPAFEIDKSTWPDGPWKAEPDRVDWQHAGYACLMLRHPHHGCWCGYVGIDRAHPFYGRNPCGGRLDVEVARDLNYGARCKGSICHVPAPGMPADVWWIGFDAGHTWDLCPGSIAFEIERGIVASFEEELRMFPHTKVSRSRHGEGLGGSAGRAAPRSHPASVG